MSVQFNSNINIPIVGNKAITTITSGYSADKSVARLFVFPPRRVVDTCKRPHTYDLSHQFVENVVDKIYNTIHGSGNGDVHRASYMNNDASAVGAVIPSNHGYMVNNRPFEENWTWIFQLDNVSNTQSSNIYTGPRLCNRRVYCGYFVNEPCTNSMGRIVENPNAVMHILHSSAFTVNNTASAAGNMSRMVMQADTDFIPAAVCMMTNEHLTELLRPQDIAESTAPTSDGMVYVANFNSLETNANKIIPVNTSIGSPRQHLHELVMSAMRGVEDATVNTSTASVLSPITNAFGNGVGNISAGIHNNLISTVGADTIGLDGTSVYQLSTLRNMFPGMELIVSEAPMGSIDDLANQSVITRSNSGSNIVVTTVPVLASNCGLSELAFRYASYVPSQGFMINNSIDNRDAFKFDNFATWSEESKTTSELRIKSFMSHFRQQVTPALYHIGGDFELMCSFTSSGLCDVLLIYNDDPTNTLGIYQSPLFLGGLNTPIVGSNSDKQHNANQLQSFKYGIEAGIMDRLSTGRQYNGFNPIRPLSDFNDPSISSSGFAENIFNNMTF